MFQGCRGSLFSGSNVSLKHTTLDLTEHIILYLRIHLFSPHSLSFSHVLSYTLCIYIEYLRVHTIFRALNKYISNLWFWLFKDLFTKGQLFLMLIFSVEIWINMDTDGFDLKMKIFHYSPDNVPDSLYQLECTLLLKQKWKYKKNLWSSSSC